MQDEPVGITYQDLRCVIAVERFVLEYVGCPGVFEVFAKETEDAWLAQLGVFQHAADLGIDFFMRVQLACGGCLEQGGVGTGIG